MNPLLMELLKRAQEPVVPQLPIERSLTEPQLDQSPGMAALKGFGAGALEGARSFTSPLNLAAMAIPGGRAMKGAVGAARGVARAIPRVAQIGQATRQAVPALGEVAAEFAPVGGEAVYNAGRAVSKAPDLAESLYKRMMASGRGNMGSETGSIDPKLLLGGGAVAGGGYAAKKLYDLIQNIKDPAGSIQKANPFGQAADILDSAAGKRGKY